MYWHKGARAESLVAQLRHRIPALQVTAAVHTCQAFERDAYAKNVILQFQLLDGVVPAAIVQSVRAALN